MGILKQLRNGKWRYGVSRRLPRNNLGVMRFRRWYPNRTIAKEVLDRLNGAIANGTIDQVLPALLGKGDRDYTLGEFWPRFRGEYCQPRMSSWQRYQQSMGFILADLGDIYIREFHRKHLHDWLEKRVKQVSQSTANKDIAALKKMFSYALEVGAVDSNPLLRFRTFRVQERHLRIPTLEEFHALVDAMPTPELAALVAVLGETGLRKSEALGLEWDHIDLRGRRVTVARSKGKTVRTVPLSDYALEHLGRLVRFIGDRHVFCYQSGHLTWIIPYTNGPLRFKVPAHRALREFAFFRDRYKCRICGSEAISVPDGYTGKECLRTTNGSFLVIDHIRSRQMGGTHDPSNLQTLCDRCNASKSCLLEGAGNVSDD